MAKNKSFVLSISIAVLFIVLALRIIFRPLNQDEGVFLTIGHGITTGLAPYRDFFDHKTPGIYFLLSIFVYTCKRSIILPKLLLIVVDLMAVLLTAKAANRLKLSPGMAAIFTLLLFIFFEGNYLITEPLMTVCLVAAFCLLQQANQQSSKRIFLAGIFAGSAFLFKQTALIDLAIGTILLFYNARNKKGTILFLAGAALIQLPALAYLLQTGALKEALNQSIILNITSYPREPLGRVIVELLPTFVQTLPIWFLALFGITAIESKRDFNSRLLLAFAFLPIPFFFVRHYPHYWIQVAPFAAILATAGSARLQKMVKINQIFWPAATLYLTSAMLLPIKTITHDLTGLKEELVATAEINHLSEANILAENQFSSFYFLTQKKPLNRYLYITEINETSEQAEEKTLVDLQNKPTTLVLWPSDKKYAYAEKLQQYIILNYHPIKEYKTLGMMVYEH